MRLAQGGDDRVLPLRGEDRLEPELGDPLLTPALADRRLGACAAEERACPGRVPGAALVVADPPAPASNTASRTGSSASRGT